MELVKKVLVFVILFLLVTGSSGFLIHTSVEAGKYDWAPFNSGLPSLNHSSLAISPVEPKMMYIGTRIGLFVSTDAGETWWSRVIDPNQGETTQVKCIAVSFTDSRIAYVGTYGRGIYMTGDGGLSWNELNNGLTSKDIETIAIDPQNPKVIYTGTYGAGIFKSTNGGASFVPKNTGLAETKIKKIVIDSQDPNLLYTALYGNAGLFKSEDGGNNWKAINIGITGVNRDISNIAIDNLDNGILFATTESSGRILKSLDYGETWKELAYKFSDTWIYDILIDYKSSGTIYLATNKGVYKSEDKGVTFKIKNSQLGDVYVRNLAINPKDNLILYASTYSNGLYKTVNAGDTWTAKSTGLPFYAIFCIQINPKTSEAFVGTEKGIYSTKDFGKTFILKGLSDLDIESIAIDPKDYNYIYAGTYYKGFYLSEDGGTTWKKIGNELEDKSILDVEVDPTDYRVIYAATYPDGIFKSQDMGNTWKAINYGLKTKYAWAIEIDPTNSKILYLGTDGGGVYKSTNGGDSWNAINKGLTNYDVVTLRINPKDPKILYAGTLGGGIFKSGDSGENWQEFSKGLENKFVWDVRLNPTYPNSVAIATEGGVFFVENYGTTWEKMNDGLTDTFVNTIAFEPNNISFIYAGTYEGGFFRKQITRTINVSPAEGGTVTPSGAVEVPFGGEVTFTMKPNEGYVIKELVFAGKKYPAYTSFKITQIAVNNTFQTIFEKIQVQKKEIVIILQIGNKNFTVDGVQKELDSPPIIKNGRTLLPIRAIIESLGGSIDWEATEKKVSITLGETKIELWIGRSTAKVNGVEKPIDSANPNVVPEIISGRTMLPVRFVTENLGAEVGWDGDTKTVTITYPAE